MNEELINEFSIVTSEGRIFDCYEYQEFHDAGHWGDPNAKTPGLKRVETEEGYAVNVRGGGKYHVVNLGVDATGPDIDQPRR